MSRFRRLMITFRDMNAMYRQEPSHVRMVWRIFCTVAAIQGFLICIRAVLLIMKLAGG